MSMPHVEIARESNEPLLDLDTKELFTDASGRAARYIAGIRSRRVFPSEPAIAALYELGGEMPADPQRPVEVIAMLDDIGSAGTVATNAARYFGFVDGAALP